MKVDKNQPVIVTKGGKLHVCTNVCTYLFYVHLHVCELLKHISKWLFLLENHEAQNFGIFDAFQLDRQNLTYQNFKALQHLQVHTDHPSKYFPQNIFCQIFERLVFIKITSIKILHYIDHM